MTLIEQAREAGLHAVELKSRPIPVRILRNRKGLTPEMVEAWMKREQIPDARATWTEEARGAQAEGGSVEISYDLQNDRLSGRQAGRGGRDQTRGEFTLTHEKVLAVRRAAAPQFGYAGNMAKPWEWQEHEIEIYPHTVEAIDRRNQIRIHQKTEPDGTEQWIDRPREWIGIQWLGSLTEIEKIVEVLDGEREIGGLRIWSRRLDAGGEEIELEWHQAEEGSKEEPRVRRTSGFQEGDWLLITPWNRRADTPEYSTDDRIYALQEDELRQRAEGVPEARDEGKMFRVPHRMAERLIEACRSESEEPARAARWWTEEVRAKQRREGERSEPSVTTV